MSTFLMFSCANRWGYPKVTNIEQTRKQDFYYISSYCRDENHTAFLKLLKLEITKSLIHDNMIKVRFLDSAFISFCILASTSSTKTNPGISGCDGVPAKVAASSGVLSSPGFDGRTPYRENLDCQWNLVAPQGKSTFVLLLVLWSIMF